MIHAHRWIAQARDIRVQLSCHNTSVDDPGRAQTIQTGSQPAHPGNGRPIQPTQAPNHPRSHATMPLRGGPVVLGTGTYIYTYRERETEKDRERERERLGKRAKKSGE